MQEAEPTRGFASATIPEAYAIRTTPPAERRRSDFGKVAAPSRTPVVYPRHVWYTPCVTLNNDLAMGTFSDPPVRHDRVTHLIPGGEEVNFDPRTCLKVYGLGNLHFNEYNYPGQRPS